MSRSVRQPVCALSLAGLVGLVTAGCGGESSERPSDTGVVPPGSTGTASSSGTGGATAMASSSSSGTATGTTTGSPPPAPPPSSTSSGGAPSECGNGTKDGLEDCDDGNDNEADACSRCSDNRNERLWEKTHDGLANQGDAGYGVAVDGTGQIVVVGRVTISGAGNSDIFVRKLAPDGAETWTKQVDGGVMNDDEGHAVAIAADGSILVAGSATTAANNIDVWVGKFDADGEQVWSKTFDGPAKGTDQGHGVAVDDDGNVYVAAQITGAMSKDAWVRQYDAAGAEGWTDVFDGAAMGEDGAFAIAARGGVIAAAGSTQVKGAAADIWTRTYDAAGTEGWTDTFGNVSNGTDQGLAVTIDSKGAVITAGYITEIRTSNAWARKVDSGKNVIWALVFNGPWNGNDKIYGVATDADDNIVVAGSKAVEGNSLDMWIRKHSADRGVAWTEAVAGAGGYDDVARGVAVAKTGEVVVTGELRNTGFSDIWIGKFAK